jgi:hypothetical protein
MKVHAFGTVQGVFAFGVNPDSPWQRSGGGLCWLRRRRRRRQHSECVLRCHPWSSARQDGEPNHDDRDARGNDMVPCGTPRIGATLFAVGANSERNHSDHHSETQRLPNRLQRSRRVRPRTVERGWESPRNDPLRKSSRAWSHVAAVPIGELHDPEVGSPLVRQFFIDLLRACDLTLEPVRRS